MPTSTYRFRVTPPGTPPLSIDCEAESAFEATILTRAAVRGQFEQPTHLSAPVLVVDQGPAPDADARTPLVVLAVWNRTTTPADVDDHARAVLAQWDAAGVGTFTPTTEAAS